jgi:hypothetical protein
MDMGVRLALPALHPPFETQSTWYADGRRHDDAATAFQTKRPLYCKVRAPFRNFAGLRRIHSNEAPFDSNTYC